MPITLAVVLLSLGRRIGVELMPIGAPGHFLVKEPVSGSLLDPFDRASEQEPSALAARMATLARTSTWPKHSPRYPIRPSSPASSTT